MADNSPRLPQAGVGTCEDGVESVPSDLVLADVHGVSPHAHAVSFYDDDADVVRDVARFIADGLARGERGVVVATAAHRAAIDEVLVQFATDAMRARVQGRYIAIDAAELLGTFMVQGSPDPLKFFERLGSVLGPASEDGCSVRVFGEMVAELWQEGNVTAALELEGLWNELADRSRFSLLCAYPTRIFASEDLVEASQVCELHAEVHPPRSYVASGKPAHIGSPSRTSQLFVPVPSAVPAARRFTLAVLRSWGADDVVDEAAVIVSELAANAVTHASSPFVVRLTRDESTIRIALDDVGPARPQRGTPSPDDFGGRGVLMVEAMAHRWGCDTLPHGKSVWAELETR